MLLIANFDNSDLFTTINNIFIVAGRLDIRLSFYEVQTLS